MGARSLVTPLPASIALAVLDLAGTMLDDRVDGVSVVSDAMTSAFAGVGIALPPEAFAAERGRQKAEAVRRLLEKIDVPAEAAGTSARAGLAPRPERVGELHRPGREADIDARAASIYAAFLRELERRLPSLSEIPDASNTLRFLRARGVRVALGSGFPSEIVAGLVRRFGWEAAGLVDYLIPEERGVSRPDPAGILGAMRRFGVVDPRAVVKAGDTVVDVEEGRNAGVWTVGVLTGAGSRDELEAVGADRVVESIAELPGLLV